MAAQADEIVALMKSLVPKRTGQLEESIGWVFGENAPQGAITLASITSRGRRSGGIVITIYAGSKTAYWARFQEFGTQKSPAQPFFYVSWRAGRKQARNRIRKAARDAAKIVAKS